MSGARLNLSEQAKSLQDEVEIPVVTLASRAVAPQQSPNAPEGKGSAVPATATVARPTPASRVAVTRTLEELAGPDRVELLPLSVRVPRTVRETLDRRYHELRGKGKRIKLEDIVTAALRQYLGIADE